MTQKRKKFLAEIFSFNYWGGGIRERKIRKSLDFFVRENLAVFIMPIYTKK